MSAAASFHSISGTEVWAEDVVEPCSYHEIINGTIRVTDSPGLGVTVNRYGDTVGVKMNTQALSLSTVYLTRVISLLLA